MAYDFSMPEGQNQLRHNQNHNRQFERLVLRRVQAVVQKNGLIPSSSSSAQMFALNLNVVLISGRFIYTLSASLIGYIS
ncbi:MAG: hypothetical protein AB7U82_07925 [Blastocatellales bacterium]